MAQNILNELRRSTSTGT